MKKRIVLLTLCCISLLCIGYPLSKKISSSSKDKTVQVSETDNTKTSAVNLPQEDTAKSSVSKDKNTSESTTAPESTDSIDSSETNNTVNNNDSTAPSAAESLNNSGNTTDTKTYANSNTTLESEQENQPANIETADDTTQTATVEETQNNPTQTVQAYVLSVNGTTMYVDLENPGARTYPGEGEERQTAFDISNAEQIQTEISDVYPASNHFICSCVSVEIEYYTENGVNIATKLTSNGQEIAPLYFKE